MLAFAFDTLTRSDDGTRVVVSPNCQVHGPERLWEQRRYACGTLVPMCMLERDRLGLAPTEALVRDRRPFVYPLELRFNLVASLTQNPDLAPDIPGPVIDQVCAGRAVVLVWIGHEPVPFHLDPEGRVWVFDIVQAFMRRHGLPPRSVWLVSGNVLADRHFAGWRAAHALGPDDTFQFRTIVMSPNTVRMQYQANRRGEEFALTEQDDVWTCTLSPLDPAAFAERYVQPAEIAEERRTGRLRPKRFLAMNAQPRLHRRILVAYLQAQGLLDGSIVSLGAAPADGDDLAGFPRLGGRLRDAWRALHPRLPLVIDEAASDSGIGYHRVAFGWPYRSAYVNIVTETEIAPHVAPICTEKMLKPMLNYQPFVALTTAGTLQHVRTMGFRTFPAIAEEGYDALDDPVARLTAIFAQLDAIAALNPAEMRDRYVACLPDLEHNRAHLLEARHPLDAVWDEIEAQLP